jgi:hypothetical protein
MGLAGVAIDIGKYLRIQDFPDLIGFLSEVFPIAIAFHFLGTDPFRVPFFHPDHIASAGIDPIIVIGGLLVAATRGQK